MDELPPTLPDDAGHGDTKDGSGEDLDTSVVPDDAATDARDVPDASEADGATSDAAQGADGSDADGDGPNVDGSVSEPDPHACDGAGERYFYADADGDGYGDGARATIGCEPPDGYVDNDDDCSDEDPQANPGQTGFFSGPMQGSYVLPFDYNCDRREVGAPGQQQEQECSGGGLLACSGGGGYRADANRPNGEGVNTHCGSNVVVSCGTLPLVGGCGPMPITTPNPFLCN